MVEAEGRERERVGWAIPFWSYSVRTRERIMIPLDFRAVPKHPSPCPAHAGLMKIAGIRKMEGRPRIVPREIPRDLRQFQQRLILTVFGIATLDIFLSRPIPGPLRRPFVSGRGIPLELLCSLLGLPRSYDLH